MYVTADFYHAHRPDIIHFLSCTYVYTVCFHLEQALETVFEEMRLDTDVLEETFA